MVRLGNRQIKNLSLQRICYMLSLILAGEAIFGLPFHVSRYFRPTFVEVFNISQTQLGILGSIYGLVATFAYLLGGGVADRMSPRTLMSLSLLVTGLSGVYMSIIPPFRGMCFLFGFWGLSTILLFWPGLIKATREWGGSTQQGLAFGVLDGGRGLFAALLAMISVLLFSLLMPAAGAEATELERRFALQAIILVYTAACFVAATSVWLTLPSSKPDSIPTGRKLFQSSNLQSVLRMPRIWLQAFIIISAYCTFKGIDYYSQYAKDIWGWTEVNAAGLSALSSWMRPIAALGAGLLADRSSASRVVILCFGLTALAYLSFLFSGPASGPGNAMNWILWGNVFISCLGLFALRGIYFALMEESNIPLRITGTAVGVISFIGYTPEIFMPIIGGWLIDGDTNDALRRGYAALFMLLLFASLVGILATLALRHISVSKQTGE